MNPTSSGCVGVIGGGGGSTNRSSNLYVGESLSTKVSILITNTKWLTLELITKEGEKLLNMCFSVVVTEHRRSWNVQSTFCPP